VDAKALVRDVGWTGRSSTPDRRHDLADLERELGAPRVAQLELLRRDVRVQCVDPDAERQRPLELGGRPL
jgi:hypothetical protein